MGTRELGRFGEEEAAKYLRRHGYRIVETNYSCRFGEIDLIAETKDCVVFVEVKSRRDAHFAQAREFVTAAKQRRLTATAGLWLAQNPTDKQPRFDVVEVYCENGIVHSIQHIENAF